MAFLPFSHCNLYCLEAPTGSVLRATSGCAYFFNGGLWSVSCMHFCDKRATVVSRAVPCRARHLTRGSPYLSVCLYRAERATAVILADPCFQLRSIQYLLGHTEPLVLGMTSSSADKKHFSLQSCKYPRYVMPPFAKNCLLALLFVPSQIDGCLCRKDSNIGPVLKFVNGVQNLLISPWYFSPVNLLS